MHLIYILVIVVAVLTVLSGLTLVFGSAKTEKPRSAWFLIAAIGEAIWGITISCFLALGAGEAQANVAPWLVKGIYGGAIIMDVALLGYISWKYKTGKLATIVFAVIGVILMAIFAYDPSVLYSSVNLSNAGNSITIDLGRMFYVAYALYFCAITPALCGFLIYQIRHTRSRNLKKGYWFFMFGIAVAGLLSLVFDILLPPTRYDLIWVGPLTIGLVILGFYYAILRFRMISLSTGWLKVMSYIAIIGSAVTVYLLIFHVVFSSLFRIANPSFQVILLNFIMIAIVLLLMPAISEVHSLTKSWILTKQIDIAYIVKKITNSRRHKMDLKEMAGFLAEHAHFSFVGFLVNGRFYGSDDFKLTPEELTEISHLPRSEKGMWQRLPKSKWVEEEGISAIGVLAGASGDAVGQVILGKPTTKSKLDREDMIEVEMIFNLMAVVVENGSRKS